VWETRIVLNMIILIIYAVIYADILHQRFQEWLQEEQKRDKGYSCYFNDNILFRTNV